MQGAFGMPTRSSSTGSGDDYVFEVSVHKDKLKISKENVSNVLDMYLNTLFQAKTSVTRDADKWILESSGSVAIKLLPAKIGTIFFDKTFPTEIVSISELVIFIQSLFIELLTGFIGLLIGLLLTQDFVLKGLQSGRVELELSRPFSRGMYLLFKFIGSLAFFFLFSLVVIVPPSIGVYWQTGIFNVGFLLTTFFITFFFASIYCVSFTYGAITRRKGGTWFAIILWIVSISAYTLVMQSVPGKEDKIYKFASITHSILPKVGLIEKYCSYYLVHLSNLPTTYVQHLHSLPPYSLFYTLSTTFLFILLFLLVGIFFFRRKNF
jgi:ABC-type transport system involved in multi-copper enzyme maturation permease subunit